MRLYSFMRKELIVLFIATTAPSLYSQTLSDKELASSAKAKGKLVANDYLSRNIYPNSSGFNYFDACSYYGAFIYGEATEDSAFCKSIYNKYKDHKPGSIPTGDVDKNSSGLLPLYLFTFSKDSSLLKLGKAAADNSVQHNGYKRYAVDDMYMTGSLMVQAFRATNDTSYLTFCAEYFIDYAGKLLQPNGLYWHKTDSKNHWGRGNGWGAAGTTELLQELPPTHPKYNDVLDGYRKQMKGLVDVQKEKGIWMQLLDSKDSRNWEETSGSAMFLFALWTGLKNGWLDADTFLEPAQKGWEALVGYLQGSKLTNVAAGFWPSTGTANDYLNASRGQPGDSHGTAAFLWAATAVIRYYTPTAARDRFSIRRQNTSLSASLPHPCNAFYDLKGRTLSATGIHSVPMNHATGILINKFSSGAMINNIR